MKNQEGFTMVEVVIATGVMSMVAFGAASMMSATFKSSEHSKKVLVSNQVYNQVMEKVNQLSYKDLLGVGQTEVPLVSGQDKLTLLDSSVKSVVLDRSVAPLPLVSGDVITVGGDVYPQYVKLNQSEYRIDLVVEKGAYQKLAALPGSVQLYKDLKNMLDPSAFAASQSGQAIINVSPETTGYKNTSSFDFSIDCHQCPPTQHRTYKWNFGVGEGISELGNPSKTFNQTGSKNVFLTVGDRRFPDTAITTQKMITIKDSSVTFTVSPSHPKVGQSVSYSAVCDVSDSNDCGDSPQYHWSFGDGGSASGQNVTHIYQESSSYNTILSVTGGADPTYSQNVEVSPSSSKQSYLDISPGRKGVAGPVDHQDTTSFSITAQSSGYANAQYVTYKVNFGDGSPVVELVDNNPGDETYPVAHHSYSSEGHYIVGLESIPHGLDADNSQVSVTSTNLVAHSQIKLSTNQTQLSLGEQVSFQVQTLGAGTNPEFTWDFGDGTQITQDYSGYASHTYSEVGEYTVTVSLVGSISPGSTKKVLVLNPNTSQSSQSEMKKVHVKVALWSDAPPTKYLATSVILKSQN